MYHSVSLILFDNFEEEQQIDQRNNNKWRAATFGKQVEMAEYSILLSIPHLKERRSGTVVTDLQGVQQFNSGMKQPAFYSDWDD